MLPQERGASGSSDKEICVEQTIHKQHADRGVQRRERQQNQELGDEHHPDKQRKTANAHSWSAEKDDGGDQIDGGNNGSDPQDEQAERVIIQTLR